MKNKLVEAARRVRQQDVDSFIDLPPERAREAFARAAAPQKTREALIEERLTAIDAEFTAEDEDAQTALRGLGEPTPEAALKTHEEAFPMQGAFRFLLDKRAVAEELDFEEYQATSEALREAPQVAPRAPKSKWNLAKLKELYKAVKGFLTKLRADLAAADVQLCKGAPVSLTARAAIDGDVHIVIAADKNAEDTHWAEAKRAAASWRRDSIGALALVAAVLGKAAEIITSVVTFMAHPLESLKQIFKALLKLYQTLSDALEPEP